MKSVPYQTLIRHRLSECIRKELHIKPQHDASENIRASSYKPREGHP